MGKILRVILDIFGGLFLITIIILVILLSNLIDETNNTFIDLENTSTTEELLNSKITNSLYNFDDNLVCEFNKEELNYFVYSIVKDIPIIKGVYINILDDESLYFEFPIVIGTLKTCLKGNVKISNTDDGFKLSIVSINAGKINVATGLLKEIILSETTIKSLNNAIEDLGIESKIDRDSLSLSVSRKDLINTVSHLTKADENSDLFVAIAELCLESKSLVMFNFGENEKIGITINISSLKYKESYGELDYTYGNEFENVKTKVDSLLGKGVNITNISSLYHYYVGGYDNLTSKEKEQINKLKLSKTEEGIKPIDNKGMGGVFEQIAFPTLLFTKFTVPIKQASFNSIFKSLEFIGKGISFTDGVKSAYILVENLSIYLNEDNRIKMLCVVNVNGTQLCVSLDANSPEKEGLGIDAEVVSLKLGENDVTSVTPTILKWLSSVLSTEEWITFDESKNTLNLNFEEYIEENFSLLSTIGAQATKSVKVVGKDKELEIIFKMI